jgi:hypothetical protein
MKRHMSYLLVAARWVAAGGLLSVITAGPAVLAATPEQRATWRWAAYYRDTATPRDLAGFDLLVLDPDHHPPLSPLSDRGQLLLAYVSLTEVGAHRDFFPRLEKAGALLEAHPHWKDARFIDIRNPQWGVLLVEHIVPQVLAAGFDGLFLDTLDDAEFLETRDPKRFAGTKDAAIAIVRTLRRHYPTIRLMVNRGYAIMPDIARSVDFVLGESVQGSFDPETKEYRRPDDSDVAWQVGKLEDAARRNPRLRILTLDYWSPDDEAGIRDIYQTQRLRGFSPYVATPLLDRVVKEPR